MTGILAGENTAALCMLSPVFGAALSAVYDILRVRRLAARSDDRSHITLKAAVIFVEDTVFSAAAAAVFSVLFYRFSFGAVRFYALTLAALGFYFWRLTFGRLCERLGIPMWLNIYRSRRRLCLPLYILMSRRRQNAAAKRAANGYLRGRKTKTKAKWIKKKKTAKKPPTSAG